MAHEILKHSNTKRIQAPPAGSQVASAYVSAAFDDLSVTIEGYEDRLEKAEQGVRALEHSASPQMCSST